jgi:hypothetical protein
MTPLKHCFNVIITHQLIVDIFIIILISQLVFALLKILRIVKLLLPVQHFNFGLTLNVSNADYVYGEFAQ